MPRGSRHPAERLSCGRPGTHRRRSRWPFLPELPRVDFGVCPYLVEVGPVGGKERVQTLDDADKAPGRQTMILFLYLLIRRKVVRERDQVLRAGSAEREIARHGLCTNPDVEIGRTALTTGAPHHDCAY